MIVFASVLGNLTFEADDDAPCVFSGAILLEQTRDDADEGTVSDDIALTFDRTKFDAVTSPTRWIGTRLIYDDEEIILGRCPNITFDEALPDSGSTTAQQSTLKIAPIGDRWAIPSTDYVPPEPSTCPVDQPISGAKSPRSYGAKPTSLSLLAGKSPASMQEFKLFDGVTSQITNSGNVLVKGDITCVDDSAFFANIPLCLEIPPFSGLRRDEIVRLAAKNVGMDGRPPGSPAIVTDGPTGDVICPVLKVYNKPILLTNGSLLPFLNDFLEPEGCYASFNTDGFLEVIRVDLKSLPDLADWTLDASLGDFDQDTLEEVPPSAPATKIIVTATEPVSGTGPGGSTLENTVRTVEEDAELYAPLCVKVRPSGGDSFLYGDGSYRSIAQETLMTVTRKVTEVTTSNGQEIRRVVTNFGFYNPAAFDPNYSTLPTGSSYGGAYGDKSFHRDEVESLIEISRDVIETQIDLNGTILGTTETSYGWFAPHRAAVFYPSSRTLIKNDFGATPPAYVYAGGTTRTLPTETYGVTQIVAKAYQYAADGTLSTIEETTTEFYSPDARCDIVSSDNPDIPPVPGNPPIENPPPEPPPSSNPAWYPEISGPVSQDGGTFTFKVSIVGGPVGGPLSTNVVINGYVTGGSIPSHGLPNTPAQFHSLLSQGCLLVPVTAEEAYAKITFSGPKPAGTCYVGFQINRTGDTHGYSNNLIFDPWQGVPPDGSL